MYSFDELKEIKRRAQELNLRGWQEFCSTPVGELQQICNGIGARFMPKWMRKLTNFLSPSYKVSACMHDFGFDMQIGFFKANRDLLYNSNIESHAYYKWFNPLLYFALWRNRKFYKLCATLGYIAYQNAKGGWFREKQKGK